MTVTDQTTPTAQTDTATFILTVLEDTTSATMTFAAGAPSPQTYDFSVGEDVSFNYPVTGGYPPYTYSATNLPSWLSLDAGTGHLSGTAEAGQGAGPWPHSVSVTVTDRDGNSVGPRAITLEIFPDTTLSWDTSTHALPTNQTFTKGAAITTINLPPAVTTGAHLPITYEVTTNLAASNFAGGTLPPLERPGRLPHHLVLRNPGGGNPHRITGTPANAFSAVTVTWTATDGDGDSISHTFDVNSGEVILTNAGTIAATREHGIGMVEGKEESYSIKLGSQPSGDVTVTVAKTGASSSDISLRASAGGTNVTTVTRTFTTTNWNTAQNVYIYAAEDAAETGNPNDTAELTHTVTGANYAGVTAINLKVEAGDNEAKRIVFNPLRGRHGESADWASGSWYYTVELTQKPTHRVRMTPSSHQNQDSCDDPILARAASGANNDGRVQLNTWDNSATSWNRRVATYIRCPNDGRLYDRGPARYAYDINTNDTTYITYDDAGSASVHYNLDFIDGNTAGFSIEWLDTTPNPDVWKPFASSPGTVEVTEGTETYFRMQIPRFTDANDRATNIRVQIGESPDLGVTYRDAAAGAGNAYMTYGSSAGIWGNRNVYVSAADDDLDNGDRTAPVNFWTRDVRSIGNKWRPFHDPDQGGQWWGDQLRVRVKDDDTSGVTIDGDLGTTGNQAAIGLTEHTIEKFSVVLNAEPVGGATVRLSAPATADLQFIPDPVGAPTTRTHTQTLSFSPSNWDTAQIVQIYGTGDGNTDDETAMITLDFGDSDDPIYEALSDQTITVNITDGQERSVGGAANPVLLTIPEGGVGYYTLKSTADTPSNPTTVIVTPTCADPCSGLTFNPPSVMFDSTSNWTDEQRIAVTATNDEHQQAAARSATITHTSSTGYGGTEFSDSEVTVTIEEDDVAGLEFSAPNGTILDDANPLALTEGVAGSYRVALTSRPAANITVRVTPSLTGFAFNSMSDGTGNAYVEFPSADWNSHKTIYVTTVPEDGDENDEAGSGSSAPAGIAHALTVTATMMATDAAYSALAATPGDSQYLAYKVDDDDEIGVVATTATGDSLTGPQAAPLTILEGGEATYKIRLGASPATGITVRVTPRVAAPKETMGSVAFRASSGGSPGATFDFTSTNWAMEQDVYVGLGQDDDTTGMEEILVDHRAQKTTALSTASPYQPLVDYARVALQTQDNDVPGVTFTGVTAADPGATPPRPNPSLVVAEDDGQGDGGDGGLHRRALRPPRNASDGAVTVTLTASGEGFSFVTADGPAASHRADDLTLTFDRKQLEQRRRPSPSAPPTTPTPSEETGYVTHAFSSSDNTPMRGYNRLSRAPASTSVRRRIGRERRDHHSVSTASTVEEGEDATYTIVLTAQPVAVGQSGHGYAVRRPTIRAGGVRRPSASARPASRSTRTTGTTPQDGHRQRARGRARGRRCGRPRRRAWTLRTRLRGANYGRRHRRTPST